VSYPHFDAAIQGQSITSAQAQHNQAYFTGAEVNNIISAVNRLKRRRIELTALVEAHDANCAELEKIKRMLYAAGEL